MLARRSRRHGQPPSASPRPGAAEAVVDRAGDRHRGIRILPDQRFDSPNQASEVSTPPPHSPARLRLTEAGRCRGRPEDTGADNCVAKRRVVGRAPVPRPPPPVTYQRKQLSAQPKRARNRRKRFDLLLVGESAHAGRRHHTRRSDKLLIGERVALTRPNPSCPLHRAPDGRSAS